MLLWDAESRSWGEFIEPLSLLDKRTLSLKSIELCFASFRPSFEEEFVPSTVSFVRHTLEFLWGRLQSDSLGVSEEEFFGDLYDLEDSDPSPAAGTVVMAIFEYADSMGRDLSTSDVLAIMSACYEAVLNSERIPRVTPDRERENSNCVRLIAAQRALIGEFLIE